MPSTTSSLQTHKVAAIRASALAPLIDFIAQTGIDPSDFLARNGLPPGSIADPYSVFPLAQYVGLFETASRTLKERELGLKLGMRIRPADMGPMGVLFSLSPTIMEGFTRLCRYVKALQGATHSSLSDVDENLVWSYRIANMSLWPRRQDAEYTLAAVCQLVRSCFASDWRPIEVHFEHGEEADAALLNRIFRAPIRYCQSGNRFVMRRDEATRVFRTEDRGLVTILEHHIADLIGETATTAAESLVDQVETLIGLNIGQKAINLDSIARELKMAPRSLQRRLMDEGTSLRELVRTHRLQLASRHLQERGARVSKVADVVGYADGTVFWRAFRRWTGEEPSALQAANRGIKNESEE